MARESLDERENEVVGKESGSSVPLQELEDEKPDFPDYPKHSDTFDTYYYLGENRSLMECAAIRFRTLVPDILPTSVQYPTKFNSFYMKIKRWARKEGWNSWVKRKEMEERAQSSKDVSQRIIKTKQSVQAYRSVLQQAVFVFARKAARSMKLVNEALKLEELLDDTLSPIKRQQIEQRLALVNERISESDIRIKSLKEARECMSLEVELGKIVDALPEVSLDGREKLPEKEAEKIDAVFEFFRKHAKDSGKRGSPDEEKLSVS